VGGTGVRGVWPPVHMTLPEVGAANNAPSMLRRLVAQRFIGLGRTAIVSGTEDAGVPLVGGRDIAAPQAVTITGLSRLRMVDELSNCPRGSGSSRYRRMNTNSYS
jgi:hypothetical protein